MESVSEKLSELRSFLTRNSYPMLMHLVDIENNLLAMHRKIIGLEEENSRLKQLLHPDEEAESSGLPLDRRRQVA